MIRPKSNLLWPRYESASKTCVFVESISMKNVLSQVSFFHSAGTARMRPAVPAARCTSIWRSCYPSPPFCALPWNRLVQCLWWTGLESNRPLRIFSPPHSPFVLPVHKSPVCPGCHRFGFLRLLPIVTLLFTFCGVTLKCSASIPWRGGPESNRPGWCSHDHQLKEE